MLLGNKFLKMKKKVSQNCEEWNGDELMKDLKKMKTFDFLKNY